MRPGESVTKVQVQERGETIDEGLKQVKTMKADEEKVEEREREREREGRGSALSSNKVEVRAASDDD